MPESKKTEDPIDLKNARENQPPDKPQVGKALDATGAEIEQVAKDPEVPAEIPVQPGTALDPALPPLEAVEPVFADDEKEKK